MTILEDNIYTTSGAQRSTSWGVLSDGGLSTSVSNRAGEWNDCAIRAFAIASGEDYDDVLALFAEIADQFGLKRKDMQADGTLTLVSDIAAVRLGATKHIVKFLDEVTHGRWVVAIPQHMVAFLDGIQYDTYDSLKEQRDGYGNLAISFLILETRT